MVSFNWIYSNIFELEFQLLCESVLIPLDKGKVIIPHIMRGDISSPENCIWFNFFIDEFIHKFKCYKWKITSICTIRRCLQWGIWWISTVVSTTKDFSSTLSIWSWCIIEVQMQVSEMEKLNRFSFICCWITFNAFVNFVNEIIILDTRWFVC